MEHTGVLIVEDEVITSLHLRSLLTKKNYKVVGAVSSGQEAISVSLDKRPAVILMDVGLSGVMTGIEAAEKIRLSYKPVFIFMTGYNDSQVLESMEKFESSYVVIKPLKTYEIEEILQQVSSAQNSDGL